MSLSSTEVLYRTLVENSSELIVLIDDDCTLAFVNRACERILGYERREMLGRSLSDFLAVDARSSRERAVLRGEGRSVGRRRELTARRKDGARVDVMFSEVPVREENTGAWATVGVISEVSGDVLHKRLECVAKEDELTGLLNQHPFLIELRRHLDHCERYGFHGALLMIRVDHLRLVRNELGHRAGEEFPQDLAVRLRAKLRVTDELARLNGEVFVVMLPDADAASAIEVARSLLDAISMGAPGTSASVSASVGITPITPNSPIEVLVDRAEAALIEAKQAGPNQVWSVPAVVGVGTGPLNRARSEVKGGSHKLVNGLLAGAGPSNVEERVLQALARPTIGHLDPLFLELADETNSLLRSVFQTRNAATFPVSGTGTAGMETMLVNFLEPGDHLVVGVCGTFGERMVDAAGRLGVHTTRVDAPFGEPIALEQLDAVIREDTVALAVVHGETSTGVAQPLEGLASLAHDRDALLLVDCVTSLGGHPLTVDELEIDVAFSATQKCLNCPPGLAPITISQRARERLSARDSPVASWYFDIPAILGYWASGERVYHHTPPVNAIFGLHESLRAISEEGLERRWWRHATASGALLAGLGTLGFEALVASEHRLWPLTTVRPPVGIDEAMVRERLLHERRIEISPGLGPLRGEVWRIGTMGTNACLGAVTRVVSAIAAIVDPRAGEMAAERVAERWRAERRDQPARALAAAQ